MDDLELAAQQAADMASPEQALREAEAALSKLATFTFEELRQFRPRFFDLADAADDIWRRSSV